MEVWNSLYGGDSAVLRHSGNRQSAIAILEQSLRNRRLLTLQIQKETVINGLTLGNTEAGQLVNDDISTAKLEHEQDLEDL